MVPTCQTEIPMGDHPSLGQVVIGHAPVLDRSSIPRAVRLTVQPEPRDAFPDAKGLLDAIAQGWPAHSSSGAASGASSAFRPSGYGQGAVAVRIVLNITSEPWLKAMLTAAVPPDVMLEVPAFMVCTPENAPRLIALHEAGTLLCVKGRPLSDLPVSLLPCFRHVLVDSDTPGDKPVGADHISFIRVGARTRSDVVAAFQGGAVASMGWALDGDLGPIDPGKPGTEMEVVAELIRRLDADEPAERLESVLMGDPELAFLLLRHVNSVAFGVPVEVSSFKDVLMLLGYARLKRWLALMLVSSCRDPAMRPAIFASVRRGFLLEELESAVLRADRRHGDPFICGVFSLLNRILGQPFAELFKDLPVSERVRQALVHGTGPYHPHLGLASALEKGSRSEILDAAGRCGLGLAAVNSALMRALASAQALE